MQEATGGTPYSRKLRRTAKERNHWRKSRGEAAGTCLGAEGEEGAEGGSQRTPARSYARLQPRPAFPAPLPLQQPLRIPQPHPRSLQTALHFGWCRTQQEAACSMLLSPRMLLIGCKLGGVKMTWQASALLSSCTCHILYDSTWTLASCPDKVKGISKKLRICAAHESLAVTIHNQMSIEPVKDPHVTPDEGMTPMPHKIWDEIKPKNAFE